MRPDVAGSVLVALMWLAAGLAPLRADEPLRYRCEPGSRLRMVIRNDFQMPVLGAQPSELTVTSHVLSADGSGTRLSQTIERTRPGLPPRTVETALAVTPTGDVSGPDPLPDDAEGVFLARTTLLLLPALPDDVVRVGSTWTADRTFPLPPMKISAPPQVRVRITYRVLAFATVGGQRVVHISMDARSLAGERIALANTGQLTLDLGNGRPLTGLIEGTASMPVFLLGQATASFRIQLLSSTLDRPSVATREPTGRGPALARVSLLGVQ